ncbi:MAG: UxaA family hydrolase, partial [Burkholderia sp.]
MKLDTPRADTGTAAPAPAPAQPNVVTLHPDDDVVIARRQLVAGASIEGGVPVRGLIPAGHKVARRAVAAGAPVHRYGQIIGFASQPIAAGEHVHVHNLSMGEFERDGAFGADAKPTRAAEARAHFDGIVRAHRRL